MASNISPAPSAEGKDVTDSNNSLGDEDDDISEGTDQLTLTCLPEVALVKIMEFLNLKERYYLSQTCHLFFELFSHPKLWQSAQIWLMPVSQEGPRKHGYGMKNLESVMHFTMAEIVKRFSHLFQHLSLEMSDYVQGFDAFALQLLYDLNSECRLSSLTLRLGPITSNDHMQNRVASYYSNTRDLEHVAALVRNAVRLKSLKIISWPLHSNKDDQPDGLFQAMMDNKKLSSLESLSLFYLDKRERKWTQRTPKLPSPEITLKIVSCLNNLSHLALRSPMISNELLIELASKKFQNLKHIEILIVFSTDAPYSEGIKIPSIDPRAWTKLSASKPEMTVDFMIVNRIPYEQLALMFLPDVPLAALSIQPYGQCNSTLIETLIEKYKRRLKKFDCLYEARDCDRALELLVQSCPQLEHLAFHGEVSYLTVMKIAKILKERGTRIICFEFKETNVKTDSSYGDVDDDIVVARDTASQELYLVGLQRWHRNSAADRSEKLDEMSNIVSELVGYNWRPLNA